MVSATLHAEPYQTIVSNGRNTLVVDTLKEGKGGQTGFKPHELLEGALAACTNLTVRIVAEKLGITVSGLRTEVVMSSTQPGATEFSLQVAMEGDMTDEQRRQLLKAVRLCPISKILSSPISIASEGC